MSQGKPRKAYLLKENEENHKPLDSYFKDKNKQILSEFLSNRLEYSPELIYDLLVEFEETHK